MSELFQGVLARVRLQPFEVTILNAPRCAKTPVCCGSPKHELAESTMMLFAAPGDWSFFIKGIY
eukprot:6210270-Pleurochrysis_carterae.AAC.1